MTRVQVRYAGRVQGVGFRATARSIARRHPVTGWVRNEPDGSVTLEAQGQASAIDALRADIRAALPNNIQSEDAITIALLANERGFVIQK